ncbi:multidrug efflux SMR transporter [bacterium]|nr:multidrug efflux SMR transporter [bacterium]
MSWIYLLIAAIFEVGWPLGLKLATQSQYRVLWIVFAIITMALSGLFLYLAQKQIPIGTAYAIWTGIGASCTFIIGVVAFHDALSLMRILGIVLIIAGVICLKI